jgi:hypothetical protein
MDKLREILKETTDSCFDCAKRGEAVMCEQGKLFEKCQAITESETAITKLFKERMLRLVGDDIEEYTPPTFTTSKKVLTEEYVKGYNQALAELRKKVGE